MTGERVNIPALRMQLEDDPRAVPWWGVQSAVTRDDLAALLDVAEAAREFLDELVACEASGDWETARDASIAMAKDLARLEWGDK